MSAYFVCLDTNKLFDLVQEIESGKEPEWWSELKKLAEAGGVKLIVPEITLLELETCVRSAEAELVTACVKAEADAKQSKILQRHLAESLKEWRKKKVEAWKAEAEKLDKWLRELGAVIEYTAEIAHRAKRRLVAGRLPRSEEPDANSGQKKWLRDQDCAIVESILWFFEKNKLDDPIIAFGTNDKKDGGFGQVEDGKGSLDNKKFEKGVGVLDETFSKGLPPSQLFHDIPKLVAFVTKKEPVKSLSPERAEVVQELKFKQEAEAHVLHAEPGRFEISDGGSGITITFDERDRGIAQRLRRQRYVQGFSSRGVRSGPYLVEDPSEGQPFSDTGQMPESPKSPIPDGITTFDASNLGDDPPKSPEKSGTPKA